MAQKRNNMKMNRVFLHFIVSALIIFLFSSLFLKAQERVKSLSIRQFEIEESIRNGLKYYLEPKDYVLRVKLLPLHLVILQLKRQPTAVEKAR